MLIPLRVILAAITMLARADAAQACIDFAPFEIEDNRQADAVFTGQLVA